MGPKALQLAGSVLLVAGGAALLAVGYSLGGAAAIAVGIATALTRK